MNDKSKLEIDDKTIIQQSKMEIQDSSDIYTEINDIIEGGNNNKNYSAEIFRSYENVKNFSKNKTEKSKAVKRKSVAFHKLFRFMNSLDIFLLILMIISSVCIGLALPLNVLIFKGVINVLVAPPGTHTSYVNALQVHIINFAILSSCVFVAGFVQKICIVSIGERQNRRYKSNYFAALLRQEIHWFDKQQTGQMITKLTNDIESIEDAISDKLPQFIQQITLFVGSIVIAASNGWKLTLVGCVAIPIMIIIFYFMIHFIKKYVIAQIRAYSIAGGIAEEILSSIRTVVAFNAQESEVERYSKKLNKAEELGIKKSICQGIGAGFVGFFVFSIGSLVFYVGLLWVKNEDYQPGVVFQVFLTIVLGSISLGIALPVIENFITAQAAAYSIFEVIDHVPSIDYKKSGIIPETFNENIVFKNVKFEYPTRPGVTILENFNFTIPFGKTVAFIGPSGSGKSTIIYLLQRFYDPTFGDIMLGDTNLRNIDLTWYRSNIGVVQQEPPLFSGSIKENIQMGKLDASEEEIIRSTQDSNAYEFIMSTKEMFDTKLGDQGAGFSGGQKQRIAIATALVRDPKLLLLDEATSALDNKSEKLVQGTLDKTIAEGKRTIIMIAHRLQTVRNADIIVVMKSGKIVEQGNHEKLLTQKGLYWEMLKSQKIQEKVDEYYVPPKKTEIKDRKISRAFSTVAEMKKSKAHQFLLDFYQLLQINSSEKCYLIFGIFASIIAGITFPCSSLIYSQMFQKMINNHNKAKMITKINNKKDVLSTSSIIMRRNIENVFSYQIINPDKMMSEGFLFAGLHFIPAVVLLVSQIIKNVFLGKAGEALTKKLRNMMMASMLKQEMAWFDESENLSGILTARLALEASLVKGAAGIQLSIFIEAAANIITAIIIGFIYSWQLSLLFFIFIPFTTLAGIMQGRLSTGQKMSSSSTITSSALVMEVLNNIRIVNSLGLQNYFQEKYDFSLKSNSKKFQIFLNGLLSGIVTAALSCSYCIIFRVGAYLIDQKVIVMIQLMRVFACFTMSSQALGRALGQSSDTEKAREAARKTLDTIDRITKIDANSGIIPPNKLSGKIVFEDVYFRYPTRLSVSVLRELSLTIIPGQSVGLVGHSGCGKSTLMQLLERYYDPIRSSSGKIGKILLDEYDLKDLNLSWVRSQIGIVKQEPTLFNMTVLENILYGSRDPPNMELVITATKMANIHDFIESLPEKYNTPVGQRGGHLSGGQKQRLCIARALYRKPVILLLDEATSALDTESEILVQESLDRAQESTTNLVIAHRLSTIKKSDQIAVIEYGKIIELGTHEELMGLRGNYYELNMEHFN